MGLIRAIDLQLSEGGTWPHLTWHQFILLNGSIMFFHLKSYNNQDLKR